MLLPEPTYELPTELWIRIFHYLPHEDLQQMRLVCKRWREIACLPEFLTRIELKITESNLQEVNTLLQQINEVPIDLLRVPNVDLEHIKDVEALLQLLRCIGKGLHSLRLHDVEQFSCLHGLVPNIRELSINLHQIPTNKSQEQLNLNGFYELQSLELMCNPNWEQWRRTLLQNLRLKCCKLKLRKLRVQHLCFEEEELLLQVLITHAATLTHLHIHFLCLPRLPVAWSRAFQQLHQLGSISFCGKCSSDWLERVFSNLPEDTPLHTIELNGVLEANNVLLHLVAQKWPHTLRVLELMFCVQISDGGLLQLASLRHNLRVLNLAYCRNVTKRGLLGGIVNQKNLVLRQLHLTDLQLLDEECICLLAARLPHLDVLSLNNCYNAVTDKSLAHIFRYQRRLQTLLLDDCIHISDVGLLGCDEAPYPISRLRGLRTLSLCSRSFLTDHAMHALRFPELRSLRLGYRHKISAVGIAELVGNCSTLEDLVICRCPMLDDDAILYIAQGLRRLRKLNVSNCFNITERAVDYIVTFCDSLQELTMSGIDSREVCDVQKRLLKVKPQLKELHL